MRKIIAIIIVFFLCFSVLPIQVFSEESGQVSEGEETSEEDTIEEGTGESEDVQEDIIVNIDETITINSEDRYELIGRKMTNNGEIIINGEMEIRDDIFRPDPENLEEIIVTNAILYNNKLVRINGRMSLTDGAELNNQGTIEGSPTGRIWLNNKGDVPLNIIGIDFYNNAEDNDPTNDLNGEFQYIDNKWVRLSDENGGGGDHGDSNRKFIEFSPGRNGSIIGFPEVELGQDSDIFTVEPFMGYKVSSITLSGQNLEMINLLDEINDDVFSIFDNGDGSFDIIIKNVTDDLLLSANFIAIDNPTLDKILIQNYAVLNGNTNTVENLKDALSMEISGIGYGIDPSNIQVSNIVQPTAGDDYGTFTFTITVDGETSSEQTGYIVKEFSDIIFKFNGVHDGEEVNEIRIARWEDWENGEFGVPAMDSGTMDIFGVYNVRMEGILSFEMQDDFYGNEFYRPFYRVQLHITNMIGYGQYSLNWFGLDIIQDDAYCIEVSSSDGKYEQRTFQWDLNRYAELTTSSYTSEVFFGNSRFSLSKPQSGIGAVENFAVKTGVYPGYIVSDNGDGTYTVEFLSDFYDHISLEVTINGFEVRQLYIHRVGVEIQVIKKIIDPEDPSVSFSRDVFHGTQSGSRIEFSGNNDFGVYATYCIPDGGTKAPAGLYVTYKWKDGTVTTEIIRDPLNRPSDMSMDLFKDGVFAYSLEDRGDMASCCDYLLYSAKDDRNAPLSINVTVLKSEINPGESFGGVFFGSGAGVQWNFRK